MQSYTEIPTGTKIKDSHDPLLNNDKTIMSCSSGTTFPTANLQVGMLCYRTDLTQLWELFDLTPTWVLISDLSKTYLTREAADARYYLATKTLDLIQAPAANVAFNTKRITGLADPTGAQDGATKHYVDTAALPIGGGTLTGGLTVGGALAITGAPLNEAQGADIASSATVNLDTATGSFVNITGTTGISAITLAQGSRRLVRFTGALLITASTSLILGAFTSFGTAAGDFAEFVGGPAGVVYCSFFFRANGLPPFAVFGFGQFTSAQQTITAAGALTIPHFLGTQPVGYTVKLHCVTANLGYTAGDEVIIGPHQSDVGTAGSFGVSIVPDATNLNIRFGSNAAVFELLNKTTGTAAAITLADWKIVFQAWA